MKYPLAITKKLLDVFGRNIALGYDIACSFVKTVKKSLLGPEADEKKLDYLTPSFHGHAHNRLCQVQWHPMYKEGIGKEDLEGCERVFSASNALAPTTRLSSAFHRVQDIEEHFGFWSEDKHVESGEYASFPQEREQTKCTNRKFHLSKLPPSARRHQDRHHSFTSFEREARNIGGRLRKFSEGRKRLSRLPEVRT